MTRTARLRGVIFAIGLLALFAAVACESRSQPDELDGTWTLAAVHTNQGKTLRSFEGQELTLIFEGERFSIISGCNDPRGTGKVVDGRFEVEAAKSTTMSCSDTFGPEVMKAEQIVFTALVENESFIIEDNE